MRKSGSNRPAKGTDTGREELSIANNRKEPKMRTLYAVAAAATIVGTTLLSQPASAERVCRQDCVGPVCRERCVERGDRDITIGRSRRDRDVIIEERRERREPGIEFRTRRPGVDVEVR